MGKAHLTGIFQIVAALLVAVLVVGLYKAKTDAARTETRVRELQAQIADTEADMRALRAEIARAESPGNIETLAKERLGLVAAGQSAALPETAIDGRLPAPAAAQ